MVRSVFLDDPKKFSFAPKLFYKRLYPSVGRWLVNPVKHSFDDPHSARFGLLGLVGT